jgi:hypothetical protein
VEHAKAAPTAPVQKPAAEAEARGGEAGSSNVTAPKAAKPVSRTREADSARGPVLAEKAAPRPKISGASKDGNRNPICSDVLNRLQIGEAVSNEEQAVFNKECRR